MHEEPSFFADPKNWVMIAFFLFFILFGKKLWDALAAMLDARGEKVKAEIAEARQLRLEADAMRKDAEQQRADAMAEAKALIEGAKAEAARITAAAGAEAEASAKRREQAAIERIAAAEKDAIEQVRTTATEIATTATRQVLSESLTAEADSRLIDEAISQLPAALATRHAA